MVYDTKALELADRLQYAHRRSAPDDSRSGQCRRCCGVRVLPLTIRTLSYAQFSIPASLWLNLHRANTKQPQSFFNLHLPIFGSILFGLGALVQQLRGPQQLEYHANLMSTSAALSYLTAVLTGFACLPVLLWLVIFHPAPIAAMILVKQGSRLPLNFTWLSSLGRRPLTMAWKTTHQWRSPAFDPTRASLLVLAVLVPVFEVTWRCAFVDHYQQGLRLQHASAIMQIVFAALRGFTLFVDARKALPRDGTLKARLLAIAAIEVALLIALGECKPLAGAHRW